MRTPPKITAAMVDAGCEIMAERWVELTTQSGLDAVPDVVSAIYEAMECARDQPQTLADAAS
jgi:hypothetical protein